MSRVFMLLDFNKNKICAKRPHGWGKMPPSLTKQFALNIYSKIWVQAVLA